MESNDHDDELDVQAAIFLDEKRTKQPFFSALALVNA
jgi:hypothetical protein